MRPCDHNTNSLQCALVKASDLFRARDIFFSEPNKLIQDQKLCHLLSVREPKRRRPRDGVRNAAQRKSKNMVASYFFRVYRGRKSSMLPVCKQFFIAAFGISKCRVQTILKVLKDGNVPKENRGGNRYLNKNVEKKQKIRAFLNSLPASESHYNRSKSCRVYLSCELSLESLYKRFNSTYPDFRASKSMFKRIFYTDFNIGFSSPASDVCGTCINLKNTIKQNTENKATLITELRMHKLRANAYYKLLNETPDKSVTFCFDLQQVHPLPKTPIQDAFYLRQISFYAFCCVDVKSRAPFFYTWCENQGGRGSVEIGSALLTHLRSIDLENVEIVRLFCDGCSGQNKNAHIVHILTYWLQNESPNGVKELILHFPVRGHSYLPADRVFGRVEKQLKKLVVISNPEGYNSVYSNVGEVKILGTDWRLYDIKKLQQVYNKVPGIKDFKKISIQKFRSTNDSCAVKYKGSAFFRFEDLTSQYASLLRKGQTGKNIKLDEKMLGNSISDEKKKNVRTLLEKQFNNDEVKWETLPELEFFKKILEPVTEDKDETAQDEETCDCLEADYEIHL